ncbi:DUF3667 domain-containing protein [Xanthovirga aplysinae]|uniref:DUF3667 domain-containing protein n=1 Tax=Xanthovirga aplysinae TaxID=2529853 RepID=UPI0012BCC515|nr:DUF3667 domain-containing protein [Xanthovirga aplysinae]MTI29753.1 DUF3667 domain-containing protein [Xanthovirga aplysinae]
MECYNCNYPKSGKYCSNCGRAIQLRRIDGKYIIQEIGSVLSFKKGILFTIKELLIRPGQNIKAFILEDRHRLVKPVIFVVFCSFIYTFLHQLLDFEDGYSNQISGSKTSTAIAIIEGLFRNYGYANILMAIFVVPWVKILFRKHNYNFFEILILIWFVFGMVMIISSFFGLIEALTGLGLLYFGGFLSFIYVSWAIGQFFDQRKIVNYFKGLLSLVLGLISAAIIAILLGRVVDLIIKY